MHETVFVKIHASKAVQDTANENQLLWPCTNSFLLRSIFLYYAKNSIKMNSKWFYITIVAYRCYTPVF